MEKKYYVIIIEGTKSFVDEFYANIPAVSFSTVGGFTPKVFDSIEEASDALFKTKNIVPVPGLKVVEYDEDNF